LPAGEGREKSDGHASVDVKGAKRAKRAGAVYTRRGKSKPARVSKARPTLLCVLFSNRGDFFFVE
jgi:hypothetical protein